MALPEGDQSSHVGPKTGLVDIQVASETREMEKTDKPSKRKNPVKTNVLRGSADDFDPLREQLMGAEGLEPFPPNMEKQGGNIGRMDFVETGGAQGGAIENDADSAGQLWQQAMDDLQRAWKSIRRMETLSDDPSEATVAGRALAFVNKAFAELEGV